MRIVLDFDIDDFLELPLDYNNIIQGVLYSNISEDLGNYLHEKGYFSDSRSFKMFTFSNVIGQYKIQQHTKTIRFYKTFKLIVSSPIERFIQELGTSLARNPFITINRQTVHVNSIGVQFLTDVKSYGVIKMISPMVAYSTLSKHDGKKITHYFSPFEKEFSDLVLENILKKYRAFYKSEPNGTIRLETENVNKKNEKIIMYKDTVIKGWTGIYRVSGNQELIKLAYYAGLGSKNSQGFGSFEFCK